jgi:hypothetical protein
MLEPAAACGLRPANRVVGLKSTVEAGGKIIAP